ncbi:hypothetical protein V6N12_065845 [Hibiscus sabdariffa]|uniref:Uncharacterized protein n=1 Tax=Hibiscus sabdariffa TaxID=183260 RepID=A0ABR2A2P1_9ROSI
MSTLLRVIIECWFEGGEAVVLSACEELAAVVGGSTQAAGKSSLLSIRATVESFCSETCGLGISAMSPVREELAVGCSTTTKSEVGGTTESPGCDEAEMV